MSVLIDSSITIYEALQNIKDGKYVMPALWVLQRYNLFTLQCPPVTERSKHI